MSATSEIEQLISDSLSQGDSLDKITRKIYLLFPTHAFKNQYDLQLNLLTEISDHFEIPISCIHIVGSAKTGVSFIKGTPFSPENSDIDIAIVDQYLFHKSFEYSFKVSKGWQLNSFSVRSDSEMTKRRRSEFLDYFQKGIFRPEKMPNSKLRGDLLSFFGRLSSNYSSFCKEISVWIYASEHFLTAKQTSAVEKFLSNKEDI